MSATEPAPPQDGHQAPDHHSHPRATRRVGGMPPLPRTHPRRSGALETLRVLFWLLTMGVIVTFIFFFVILGQINLIDAWPMTLLVVVLIVLWVIHGILDHRHREEFKRDPRLRSARERRGF